jgi:hypothetical protein
MAYVTQNLHFEIAEKEDLGKYSPQETGERLERRNITDIYKKKGWGKIPCE